MNFDSVAVFREAIQVFKKKDVLIEKMSEFQYYGLEYSISCVCLDVSGMCIVSGMCVLRD